MASRSIANAKARRTRGSSKGFFVAFTHQFFGSEGIETENVVLDLLRSQLKLNPDRGVKTPDAGKVDQRLLEPYTSLSHR